MSGPLRSKRGCWTCRLRKKKCDEHRPHCSTCESLSITCYGFGSKPDWMNNVEKGKAVANSLKEIVKHTSRRKAITQFAKPRDTVIRLAPKPSNSSMGSSTSGQDSSHQNDVAPPSDPGLSQNDGDNVPQDGSAESALAEIGDNLTVGPEVSISEDEYVLLMHFLDIIFPLQYPMYKPGLLEGGRGWLLALLLQTKPLHHAALAISVYYRRKTMLGRMSHQSRVTALVQQENHLEICIKLLHEYANSSCSTARLGTVTAIMQMVFFELFKGDGDTWQAHLQAAMNMYQLGYKQNLVYFNLAEKSRTILCEDLPLSEDEPTVTREVVSFRFLGSTMIWLDITSSITTGMTPYLLSHHSSALAPGSQVKLENIMGCKNWVMLQIGRISALHERKTQALRQGNFNCVEFEPIVADINREIQYGISQEAWERFNISELNPAKDSNTLSDPTEVITNVFTSMGLIYLQLAIQGFQNLEILDATISAAVGTLKTQIPTHLLPALVAPLYFIGCVVKQEDEQFFQKIFSSSPLLDPSLKHRGRILPILQEIWAERRTTPGYSWEGSLELAHNMLLV